MNFYWSIGTLCFLAEKTLTELPFVLEIYFLKKSELGGSFKNLFKG